MRQTITFCCMDALNIEHIVVRSFYAETKEELWKHIKDFAKQLNDAGWIVLKTEVHEETNLENQCI